MEARIIVSQDTIMAGDRCREGSCECRKVQDTLKEAKEDERGVS